MKYQFFCYSLTISCLLTMRFALQTQASELVSDAAAPAIEQQTPSAEDSLDAERNEMPPDALLASDLPASDLPTSDLPASDLPASDLPDSDSLNLPTEVIEQSPVLQRWTDSVPNVQTDIRTDPSFKTRIQAGYTFFPSSDSTSGFVVSVEDVFLGKTPLTWSADYQQNFRGDRVAYGTDLHYYVLPLGGYFNLAPILGYRHAEAADDYRIDGVNMGVRFRFVPSRTGAADITLDQSWVVGDSESLTVTQLNFGYALTQNVRLSTDFEWQSIPDSGDSRVGLNLEWAL
ncbi:MAG: hypothetical protein AAFO84_06045 [Cyanobacteria bacterium J06598_1]